MKTGTHFGSGAMGEIEQDHGMGMAFAVAFVVLGVYLGLSGWLWPYTIETVGLMVGKPVEVAFWQGALLGLVPFIGQFFIPAAVVTWVFSLFLL